MKRQMVNAALGLAMAFGTLATASPAFAEAGDTVVLHGCLVPQEDGTVAFHGSGFGMSASRGFHRGHIGPDTAVASQSDGSSVCGAIAATQNEDGTWSYKTVNLSGDGAGTATVEQQSGTWTPPARPFRQNR